MGAFCRRPEWIFQPSSNASAGVETRCWVIGHTLEFDEIDLLA
jgi:hypothetical protein